MQLDENQKLNRIKVSNVQVLLSNDKLTGQSVMPDANTGAPQAGNEGRPASMTGPSVKYGDHTLAENATDGAEASKSTTRLCMFNKAALASSLSLSKSGQSAGQNLVADETKKHFQIVEWQNRPIF